MLSLKRTVALLAMIGTSLATVIPVPSGIYNVTVTNAELTDTSRIDPFAPSPTPRDLVISIFQPTHCDTPITIPYAPPTTASVLGSTFAAEYGIPNNTFSDLQLSVCPNTTTTCPTDFPTVLFSPGTDASRLAYSALAIAVAEQGYNVITIDHPYDAALLEYSDGRLVFFNVTDDTIPLDVEVRAADVSFILNELANLTTVQSLLPTASTPFNTSQVFMFGHSLGGATAAQAMLNDTRIIGGMDLDGALYDDVVSIGLDRPFAIFQESFNTTIAEYSWNTFWPLVNAYKIQWELQNSGHGAFTDFGIDLETVGIDVKDYGEALKEFVGANEGQRTVEVVSGVVATFAGFVFGTKGVGDVEAVTKRFGEVNLARQGGT